MPLSLNKLNKLLTSKGMIPRKYFVIQNACVYIEILIVSTAETLLLYIPSKYNIYSNNSDNVYQLSYLDITEDGNIPSDYAGNLDNFELGKQYDQIDINNIISSGINVEKKLEENYNHPLDLKDMTNEQINKLREIFRQLRRLKLCVQNIKYKVAILYKNYLCCVRRDNTYEGFTVKHLNGTSNMRLIVTLDLESLYDKIDTIELDVQTIKEGIYGVLNKNQSKHTSNLQKILEYKENLVKFSDIIMMKKIKYHEQLKKLENMLTSVIKKEKTIITNIMEIEEQYSSNPTLKGLHNDIEKSGKISGLESELSKLTVLKQEIIKNIMHVKDNLEDVSLCVDKIYFDNTVMLDAIMKNFILLSELS